MLIKGVDKYLAQQMVSKKIMEDSENTHVEQPTTQTPVDTREQKWPILMYTRKLAILTMEKDDIVLAKEIIKRAFFLIFFILFLF